MHVRALVRSVIAVTFVAIVPRSDAAPQHAWQSDVSVRALELTMQKGGTSITARVVVATDSGDARGVRLEIMLPVGVGVVTVPDGCRPSPSPIMSLSARVTCVLGDLRVREIRELSIVTTGRPASREPLPFAVFAFSDTPDPQPSNNFAERGVP
jgi:hypothetical protein